MDKSEILHPEFEAFSENSGSKNDAIAITLTASAAKRIKQIVASSPGNIGVRLQVDGGGCSGYIYSYSLAQNTNEDDHVIQRDGASLIVDELSIPFLQNSEIDFAQELVGEAFKVNNPNATSQCGCGISFNA